MKLQLIVRREGPGSEYFWVVAAADEYTLEEWNGVPDFIQKELDEDPGNTRTLWVDLPDGSLRLPFVEPTVNGTTKP